jgi:hypothetical protein
MKLTIDTKEDSKEEIKKAIRMLSAIVGDSEIYTNRPEKAHHPNIFESSEPISSSDSETTDPPVASGGGLFGMFGNPSSSSSPSTEIVEEREEPEEKPEIQIIDY